jgi:hypothetical protein
MAHLKKSLLLAVLVALLACQLFLLASPALAQEAVQRSGTIEDVVFNGLYTYITVKDAAGKEFFVVTELCKVVPDALLEVIRSEHFPKMNIPPLGGKVADVYLAKLIKIDGREIIASTSTGLIPQGCQILR